MDGTGKTTSAKVVKRYLENKGLRCKYIWFPYKPHLIFSYMAVGVAWLLLGRKRPIDKYIPKNRALLSVWLLSMLFDYSLYIFCRILPNLLKGILVCDRYVYDVVVRLKFFGALDKKLVKLLLAITPRPDLIFLLDAPPKVALKRKKEETLAYYVLQRKLYTEILNSINLDCIVIDTNKNRYETNKEIRQHVDLLVDERSEV